MPATLPPHALAAPAFRFRHLANLAGRAPIGGAREVALACFVAARLAADCADASPADDDAAGRAVRSAGARAWLATLALPTAVRLPATQCAERCADGSAADVGRELALLASAASGYLDAPSRGELEALAAALQR